MRSTDMDYPIRRCNPSHLNGKSYPSLSIQLPHRHTTSTCSASSYYPAQTGMCLVCVTGVVRWRSAAHRPSHPPLRHFTFPSLLRPASVPEIPFLFPEVRLHSVSNSVCPSSVLRPRCPTAAAQEERLLYPQRVESSTPSYSCENTHSLLLLVILFYVNICSLYAVIYVLRTRTIFIFLLIIYSFTSCIYIRRMYLFLYSFIY